MDNKEPDIEIKEDINNPIRRRSAGGILIPIGLVCVGGVLLAHQFGMPMPDWMFSWQFLLIVIGIFSGLAHAFRGPGWLIMILIGTFFLMDQLIPGLDIHRFIWPAVIILVGLIMLIRPKNRIGWSTNGIGNGSARIGNRSKGIGKDGRESVSSGDIREWVLFQVIRQIRMQVKLEVPIVEWVIVQKVFRQKILSMQLPSWEAFIKIFSLKILREETSPSSWVAQKLI